MTTKTSPRKWQIEEENFTESMIKEPLYISKLEDTKSVYEDLKLLVENINSRSKQGANDSIKKREWKRFSIDKFVLDSNM